MSVRVNSSYRKGYNRKNTAGRELGIFNRILSKISIFKSIRNKKNNYISKGSIFRIKMLLISEEVDKEYKIYRAKKTRKNKSSKIAKHFSFYNNDGSFNCIGILLGMCSDDTKIRDKALRIFFSNMEKIIGSEEFKDLVTFVFSVSVFLSLYCNLFFNIGEFLKHKMNILI